MDVAEASHARFVRTHRHVQSHHPRLLSLADSAIPAGWRGHDVPMLTRPGWILPRPLPLGAVELDWHDDHEPPRDRPEARLLMPRSTTYSGALTELAGMSHLYDGSIYRPVRVEVTADGLRLGFSAGSYFGHLDRSEVLAYEAAALDLRGEDLADGPYRRALGDPFDLANRVSCLGMVVLTLRVADGRAGFYLHQRNGDQVVSAPNVTHVVPAGEFAPARPGSAARAAGFDLWQTVLREYAEEFLDVDEAYAAGGTAPDYDHDPPFREITAAYRSGRLRLHVLGVGLDTLTWTPELLLACAIDADAFDTLFAGIVQHGKEGTILTGPHGHGLPFEASTVDRYAHDPATRNAARATLKLAWRHRATICSSSTG